MNEQPIYFVISGICADGLEQAKAEARKRAELNPDTTFYVCRVVIGYRLQKKVVEAQYEEG